MGNEKELGLFFKVEELKIIFKRFKSLEHALSSEEREILNHIEQTLYDTLAVDEIEALVKTRAFERGGLG
ncbi:MAG: hypothetical protein LBT16_08980 [Treponema sp.]|jgi:hypothetical protein|nr:hypothetical protein [Treponema sp.]